MYFIVKHKIKCKAGFDYFAIEWVFCIRVCVSDLTDLGDRLVFFSLHAGKSFAIIPEA